MRFPIPLVLVVLSFSLAGCVTSRSDGSGQVQTSSQAGRESLKGAAESPLRDLNVVRTKVPEVLLTAWADPDARPRKGWKCADIIALVNPLNEALGADLDAPSTDDDGLLNKGKGTALGVAAGAASDAIPFRGWVRKLTGAERHDSFVQAAIIAGGVRRAYLKGLGEARGCDMPAAPSHILAGSEIPSQSLKPRYPTHRPEQP